MTAKAYLLIAVFALSAAALSCSQSPEPSPTAQPTDTPSPSPSPGASPGASSLVLKLEIAEPSSDIPKYARKDWKHWTDENGDCQDARQEVLIAESTAPVTYEQAKQCRVEFGEWTGPYTGTTITNPGDLDVDHMVPLANAHKSGGWRWSADRKRAYANSLEYPGHLIATTARANRSKGAKGPEEWRPPDSGYWCQYATDWITIKQEWGLTATAREADALKDMAQSCDTKIFIQTTDSTGVSESATPNPSAGSAPATSPKSTTAPMLVPSMSATDKPTPMPVFEDRNCSDFDTWKEAQAFFEAEGGPDKDPHKLDRDKDGEACTSLPGAP